MPGTRGICPQKGLENYARSRDPWIRMDQEMDYSDPRGVGGPGPIGGYDITITLYTLTSLYSSTYTYEYLLP